MLKRELTEKEIKILERIKAEKNKLIAKLNTASTTDLRERPEYCRNDLHMADSAKEYNSVSNRLNENRRKLIKKYDEVVEAIKAGTHGICTICEGPVEDHRPLATKCIECKDEHDNCLTVGVYGSQERRRVDKVHQNPKYS